MKNIFIEPERAQWKILAQRPVIDTIALESTVADILSDVKENGDNAIKKYSKQFDGVELLSFKATEEEIKTACDLIEKELVAAIILAKANIERFHATQKENSIKVETMPGVVCWRQSVAIQKVGLYIPGGTAPLFSSLLMLAIPAIIAGCKDIIVCSPAGKDGNIHPAILFTANLLGLKNIYKIGGVQAIAAMAYGSATVPKVDKLFGPGNQYVTCAKQLVNKAGIAIDMPAGPSEVAVYADASCVPAFVAADLLSQAEHGADSQVVLVATNETIIKNVKEELTRQLPLLPRNKIATESLKNSRFIIYENMDDSFEFLNEYAPEHLIIASDKAAIISDRVVNAGSVFLGNYSPEAAGDYASGTNHTLPTNGYAKAYSGVSVDSFVKKITYQQLTKEGIKNIGKSIELMAAAEGLDGHKNAVNIRTKEL